MNKKMKISVSTTLIAFILILGTFLYFSSGHLSKADYSKAKMQAITTVSRAEELRTDDEITKANKQIKKLNKKDQEALNLRMNHLSKQMLQLEKASELVTVAETRRTIETNAAAQRAVNLLDSKILSKDKKVLNERIKRSNICNDVELGS